MIASTRKGRNTGPGRPRTIATTSASTRMMGSAIRKIFTFRRKARAICGNVSLNSPLLRNALLNSSQPGEWTIANPSPPKTTTVLAMAIRRPRRPLFKEALLQDGDADDLGEPGRLDLRQRAVFLHRRERRVDAAAEGVPLLEDHPEVLAGRARELAEDLRVRHLHGRDVERGRQVDDDAVDELVFQREDRLVVRVEDLDALRLDRRADERVARGAELRGERVRLQRGDRLRLRDRRPVPHDDRLVHVV